MDRNLVTTYGFIAVVALSMAVLLALATPFGDYIGEAYVAYVKMAKKDMDNEMNHGYEDNMEYFDDMMNKDIFVAYLESGLYETNTEDYEAPGAYEPKFEMLSAEWDILSEDLVLYVEDAVLKSTYGGVIIPDEEKEKDRLIGDIVLSNSVMVISESCFENRTRITGVFIKGTEEIKENAFKNCMNMKTLYISAPTIKVVGKDAFKGCGLRDIYFNGTRAEFSKIKWEGFSNITVTIHCTDQEFGATI